MKEVNELKTIAEALNTESDALLQETIKTIEEKVNLLNIGLELWLMGEEDVMRGNFDEPITQEQDGAWWKCFVLGYFKFTDGWSLAMSEARVRLIREDESESDLDPGDMVIRRLGTERELLKAPRSIRVQAAKLLPKLIGVIKGEAEDAREAIREARRIAESL